MKPPKLITTFGVAILISLPSIALAKGKPPKPPVEPEVVYTVALTKGVFTFPAHEVTLNSKGRLNSFGTDSLVIGPPGINSPERAAGDAVIDACAGPMVGDFPVDDVMYVNFDDWAVGRNGDDGNLWISLEKIRLPNNDVPEKEIQIQLQLRDEPETTQHFLPTGSTPLVFNLNWYVVWGKPLSGKRKNRAWNTCYESGDSTGVNFLPAELVIAIAEE
jgi:hypothetical protein